MTIDLPKYTSYIEASAEWLGNLPSHWTVLKMKYIFRDVSVKNKPDAELLSVTQNQGVVPRTWVENRMVMPSGALESFKFINEGDFAISLRSFEGGLEYCYHDDIISPAYTVLKAQIKIDSNYYKFLFKSTSFISELQTSVVGIREGKNISYGELCYSLIPIPPLSEQTTIANFLNEKTAQIDNAIAQKERLIELLKERRQILIHKAVTRGLNPDVKMKDSGVEWIGEVPEHWEICRLKKFVKNLESGVSVNASEVDSANSNEVGVLKTSCVYKYIFEPNENKKVFENEIKRVSCPVRANSIIISRMNAPELVGASGLVTSDFPNLFLPDRLWQTVFHKNVVFDISWLSLIVSNERFRECITSIATGSSPSMKNISKGDFLGLRVPVPSIEEQTDIAQFAEEINSKTSTAVRCKEKEIEKLKEYKATLINAAVTGKIKVKTL